MLPLVDYFGQTSGKEGLKDALPYAWGRALCVEAPTLHALFLFSFCLCLSAFVAQVCLYGSVMTDFPALPGLLYGLPN